MQRALFAGFLALSAAFLMTGAAAAGERTQLGRGAIFNNDFLGDGKDRWRTSSYTVSRTFGTEWTGEKPLRFGELFELRLRTETLAPSNLVAGGPPDRRYAGTIAVGLATHFQTGAGDFRLGADVVATGPQTGVGSMQGAIHRFLGAPVPGDGVLAAQIPNGFHVSAETEISRNLQITERFAWRPFLEAQVGVESMLRIGGDMILGSALLNNLMLRDITTGQLYTGLRGPGGGWSLTMGGDIAKVFNSIYLPASDGYALTKSRKRLRAGLYRQGPRASFFYGLTWLGKEFKAQKSTQVLGSLQVTLNF